jgi:hypothetical protein
MADPTAWGALGPREQQEKRRALEDNGGHLRSLLQLSGGPIRTLEYTSADADVRACLTMMPVLRLRACVPCFCGVCCVLWGGVL